MDDVGKRFSLQPWIPWSRSGLIKDNTTCESPDTLLTKEHGIYVKMQDIGLIFVVPKEWD